MISMYLLEIKDLLKTGVNIAGIKQIFEMKNSPAASKDVKQVIIRYGTTSNCKRRNAN